MLIKPAFRDDDNNVNQRSETGHQVETFYRGRCEAKASITSREGIMRRMIATAFMVAALLALVPTAASAGERLFDGALGAASGALLFGAPGFVAGGVVGYVAGPRISRGLGFHRHYHYSYYGPYGYYSRCWDRACW